MIVFSPHAPGGMYAFTRLDAAEQSCRCATQFIIRIANVCDTATTCGKMRALLRIPTRSVWVNPSQPPTARSYRAFHFQLLTKLRHENPAHRRRTDIITCVCFRLVQCVNRYLRTCVIRRPIDAHVESWTACDSCCAVLPAYLGE